MSTERENIEKWLEDFRARDSERTSVIELDLTEEELAKLERAAASLGMNIDEYCNYALEKAVFSKLCPTCRQYRKDSSAICSSCGEIE